MSASKTGHRGSAASGDFSVTFMNWLLGCLVRHLREGLETNTLEH